ncbi:MAG: helix-turn-helix domain-containing protein [Roseburia sp.]|nr:helix-turn-helix domain-containing protein [Ruminococcus sp.]MCM1155311.1 helix-turn-helix domain-containing protein [Roseburia sp.]MCM1243776.1 helix-turn-helix domain-containing protein [Roseburia sp.]
MPFVQVDIEKEIEKHCQESPSFAKSWNESREEYRLIGEMIRIRKAKKVTQNQLAVITGSKQQVISRIEKKESSPSLKIFCSMLSALGYELQIVKKANTN